MDDKGWAIADGANSLDVWVRTGSVRDCGESKFGYWTRVYGGDFDGEIHSYATREEAQAGHRDVCRRVFGTFRGERWRMDNTSRRTSRP